MDGYRPMVVNVHALAERGLVPDPPVVNILLGSRASPAETRARFGLAGAATPGRAERVLDPARAT
jgi:hypothetical protein